MKRMEHVSSEAAQAVRSLDLNDVPDGWMCTLGVSHIRMEQDDYV